MTNSVNVASQSVAVNAPVLFGNTRIQTGCTVRHENGSGRFVILKPGIYRVLFNASITAAASGTGILNLVQDGEQVPGANITTTVGTTPTEGSFSTLVRVYCGNSTVSVANVGTTALTLTQANIVIERVC